MHTIAETRQKPCNWATSYIDEYPSIYPSLLAVCCFIEMNMEDRVLKSLYDANIFFTEELLEITYQDLIKIKGIGRKFATQLVMALDINKLYLKE